MIETKNLVIQQSDWPARPSYIESKSGRQTKRFSSAKTVAAFFPFLFVIVAMLFAADPASCDSQSAGVTSEVRVGSELEFPPYAFLDESRRPAGFSIDLIKAVSDAMGLTIRISVGPWGAVWQALRDAQLDVLPIVAKVPERRQLVDFCLPHTETYDAFFVRKGSSPISNIASAQGMEIVVMRSDAAHHEMEELNFKGKLILVDTIPEGLLRVASGKHDAFLGPVMICYLAIDNHWIRGLTAGPAIPDYKRVFSFAVKKGDTELAEKLNQGLLIIKTSGEYGRIYDKWLTVDDPWLKMRKYFLPAVGTGIAIVLVAGFWFVTLRRLVKNRSLELAEKNEMLCTAHEGLELRIRERTAELSQANESLQSEIAVRRQAEEKIRLNLSRLKMLVDILQHPSETIQDFLDYALDQAIQLTESKIGYIYHYHEDRREFVLNSWSREVMAECAVADPSTCYELDKTGIWGEAVRQRRPIIVNDYQAVNPLKKGCPQGHVRLVKFMSVPIFKDDGIVGVVGLANKQTDYEESDLLQVSLLMEAVWKVTERMRAEDSMLNSKRRLSDIVEFLPDATLAIDKEKHVIIWNNAIEKMTGISAAEMIGKGDNAYAVPFYGEARPMLMDIIFEDNRDIVARYPNVSREGDAFTVEVYCNALYNYQGAWVLVKASPLFDQSGNIVGAIESLRDITDLKRAEQALIRLNETLEQRVAEEVDKNIRHERLLIQQSRLAAMGEMIGNIAHQWRQPLNALGLLLYNIKDAYQFNTLDAAYLDQAVADGRRMVQKMSTTISDFSNFFRPDKENISFSAIEQITEAIALVESSFRHSNISVHIDAPQDLKLLGFPNEYSQVLLNLLSNARESILAHNQPLPARVDIVVTEQDGQGCVSVCDNGGGIPEEILDRIFDPYFSTKEKGSGIGLYMSKMIIERNMYGSITARNIEGGAEFRVCAPLSKETRT